MNKTLDRYLLATRKQKAGESLDEFIHTLKTLNKDYKFCLATAAQYWDEAIRDAIISGIIPINIWQCLLENKTFDLQTVFDKARVLDTAQNSSEYYKLQFMPTVAATRKLSKDNPQKGGTTVASTQIPNCFFYGYNMHP